MLYPPQSAVSLFLQLVAVICLNGEHKCDIVDAQCLGEALWLLFSIFFDLPLQSILLYFQCLVIGRLSTCSPANAILGA